jgi:hypothetical protein
MCGVMKTTFLSGIAAVIGLSMMTGCANHQSAKVWRASAARPAPKAETSTIGQEQFNPITQDFETRPPYGSRGNSADN